MLAPPRVGSGAPRRDLATGDSVLATRAAVRNVSEAPLALVRPRTSAPSGPVLARAVGPAALADASPLSGTVSPSDHANAPLYMIFWVTGERVDIAKLR